jgi:hypothetical protein
LGSFESLFLGLNNFLGGNFLLDLTFNSLDGVLNFGNEVFEVLDLGLNGLLLVGEKIMLLLGGDLGGEHFVLGLDVLLEVLSQLGDLFSDLVNSTLSNDSTFIGWGLGVFLNTVSLENFLL